MALTRKFLSALGIDADKIDEIITAHSETVDALKTQIEEQKSKVADLQKAVDDSKKDAGYFDKYTALQADFDSYKEAQEAKEAKAAVDSAYRELLKEAGITDKRIGTVLKVTDTSGIELDENGSIKGKDDLLTTIKTEWADFISAPQTQGAQTTTPPANTGGNPLTKKDILAIKDTAERQAKIVENHELFGF